MRLTTRLMQIASWLLLHRAVREGEMSLAQANKEKSKVKLTIAESTDEQALLLLPERLRGLIEGCRLISDRVRRLDTNIYAPPLAPDQQRPNNPVGNQLGMLKAAFELSGRQ
jgi:regulator of CtrA degradation